MFYCFCRRGIALASLGGPIYAIGGLDDNTCFSDVERYDIESDQWSTVAPMNTPRGGVGSVALIVSYTAPSHGETTSLVNTVCLTPAAAALLIKYWGSYVLLICKDHATNSLKSDTMFVCSFRTMSMQWVATMEWLPYPVWKGIIHTWTSG